MRDLQPGGLSDLPPAARRAALVVLSTPVMGLLIAVISWLPTFAAPTPGLDPSWQAGIYMAVDEGLDFGRDLIYTWGPLGFIGQQPAVPYDPTLAMVSGLYQGLLHIALAIGLLWVLRPRFGLLPAAPLAFLGGVLPSDPPLVLAMILCLAALDPEPRPLAVRALPLAGGVFAGMQCLVTPRFGPPVLAACAIAVLALDDARRRIALLAGSALLTFLVLWLALGHSLLGIDELLRYWSEVVRGYSEAAGIEISVPGWLTPASVVVTVALLGGTYLAFREAPRRAVAACACVALMLFALYKHAYVAHDPFHTAPFFATSAAIALALPWPRGRLVPAFVGMAALLALAIAALPAGTARYIDPRERWPYFTAYVETVADPASLDDLAAAGRSEMLDFYGVDRRTLALLRGHPVHIDPWEAGVAWAYRLDWRPLPMFQDYNAYTEELDRWNSERLVSPDGPQRILRENTAVVDPTFPFSIDNRIHAWDPPGAAVAMLCNYRELRTTQRWQVLERGPDRCGEQRRIASLETSYGEAVRVPEARPGEAVLVRVDGAAVSGLERLRAFLYRAEARYAFVNDDPTPHRLVPGTAAEGLLLEVPPRLDFPAPFALAPGVRRLRFEKGGSADPLRLDFYAMPLAPFRAGPPSEGRSG